MACPLVEGDLDRSNRVRSAAAQSLRSASRRSRRASRARADVAANSRLGGSEGRRHLAGGEAVELAQDERGPLLERQCQQRARGVSPELGQRSVRRRIGPWILGIGSPRLAPTPSGLRPARGIQRQLAPASPPAAQVAADVGRDPIEVGGHRAVRLQAVECPVEAEEGLLGGVLRFGTGAQEPPGDRVDAPLVEPNQALEGRPVSRPGAEDEALVDRLAVRVASPVFGSLVIGRPRSGIPGEAEKR